MSDPILQQARNIYEQQTYNRRMTWLLIVIFVLLITAIGVGFDVFLTVETPVRFIMLPFVVLMVASGIWNFRHKTAAGLWKKSEEFAEDDDDVSFSKLRIRMLLGSIVLIIFLPVLLDPHLVQPLLPEYLNANIFRYVPIGTTLSVIVGIFCILTSLRWGPNSVLWSMRATEQNKSLEQSLELSNVVKEMSLAAGIPTPSVYIVNDSDPNAFAIGTDPGNSSLVVTTGLLSMLDREELQGVIAHEMSHIRNSDTRFMTMITVLFGAVLLLSEWMKKCALLGGFSGSRVPGAGWLLRSVLFAGWLLTILFAPLIARMVAMAVSRQREYLADAGGAELTRNPKALARALTKIENAADPTTSFQKGIAHLCVVDPLGKSVNSKEGWWADLFGTHPPMKNRIMLLHAMAYETIR